MSCRQLVLLAAGRGTRLAAAIDVPHKALAKVNGHTMFDRALDRFEAAGVEDVVIASGHAADALRARVSQRAAHGSKLSFRWAHNPEYATTNNIHSLAFALDLIEPPFILAECDVVFGDNVARSLLAPDRAIVSPYTDDLNGSAVALAADDNGRIDRLVLGRDLPDDRSKLYKTVNLYSFSAATFDAFAPAVRRFVAEERSDAFYEAVLSELLADAAIELGAVVIPPHSWMEVDTADDLHTANELARGNKLA